MTLLEQVANMTVEQVDAEIERLNDLIDKVRFKGLDLDLQGLKFKLEYLYERKYS